MPKKKENRGRPFKDLSENIPEYKHYTEIYERAKVYWLVEITDERNVKDWIEPNTPLPYYRTAYELWHSITILSKMTDWYKEVREHREAIKKDLFKEMQKNSEGVLSKAFDMEKGWMEMKDAERARLALDFKKATDKKYNPTQAIDINIGELDFSDLESLKEQLSEELSLLN